MQSMKWEFFGSKVYITHNTQVIETLHIVGWLITALYYNNLGYVLAQVVGLVFRKQNAQSKLLEHTTFAET